jgi:hypothetical protein
MLGSPSHCSAPRQKGCGDLKEEEGGKAERGAMRKKREKRRCGERGSHRTINMHRSSIHQ